MAAGLTHAKSTVHIGDGFKFLNDYKNSFDVIITDSSDPEGPAESLFQKPYFQLLHDALREGGVITTQGCMSHFYQRKGSATRVLMMGQSRGQLRADMAFPSPGSLSLLSCPPSCLESSAPKSECFGFSKAPQTIIG